VLNRIEEAIKSAARGGSAESRRAAEEKLCFLADLREGRARATLVVWDPRGQSAIVHPRASVRALSEEELSKA
jgi:C4-type Zn-finger protein